MQWECTKAFATPGYRNSKNPTPSAYSWGVDGVERGEVSYLSGVGGFFWFTPPPPVKCPFRSCEHARESEFSISLRNYSYCCDVTYSMSTQSFLIVVPKVSPIWQTWRMYAILSDGGRVEQQYVQQAHQNTFPTWTNITAEVWLRYATNLRKKITITHPHLVCPPSLAKSTAFTKIRATKDSSVTDTSRGRWNLDGRTCWFGGQALSQTSFSKPVSLSCSAKPQVSMYHAKKFTKLAGVSLTPERVLPRAETTPTPIVLPKERQLCRISILKTAARKSELCPESPRKISHLNARCWIL